ncbi:MULTISPECIES: hypothetical protein [Cohnella]|uniref:hypothetical protein n=1 Tax=Cohnella TaxID=329857 RepID=UPI0009BA5C66|nr:MULTISPECIES: hypothetical protein [Cohnella]MBN2980390.1 hypothetical protein [Cohnella algarum]
MRANGIGASLWAFLARVKWLQVIYVAGIVGIVAFSVYSLIRIESSPGSAARPPGPAPSASGKTADTLTTLIVKPIVESETNQVIFRGLFYIFVWLLLFLVVPVALMRLRRFRFFQVEFELETEKAAMQNAIVTSSKASLMAYLTGNDVFVKTLACLDGNSIRFQTVLKTLLEEIQTAYRETFNAAFVFEVYENDTPAKYRHLAQDSLLTNKAACWNKPNNDSPFKCNLLVYRHELDDGEYLVTVWSSYSTQFDLFDQQVLPLLHNVIMRNIETIELMVVATYPVD